MGHRRTHMDTTDEGAQRRTQGWRFRGRDCKGKGHGKLRLALYCCQRKHDHCACSDNLTATAATTQKLSLQQPQQQPGPASSSRASPNIDQATCVGNVTNNLLSLDAQRFILEGPRDLVANYLENVDMSLPLSHEFHA